MSQSFKPVWFVSIIFVLMMLLFGIRKLTEPAQLIPWQTNLTTALAQSKSQDKPVMLYFTADWCGPCQSMKRNLWSDEKAAQLLKDHIPVKIDVDAQPNIARQFNVTGIPRVQLLSADGSPGRSHIGALSVLELARFLAPQ